MKRQISIWALLFFVFKSNAQTLSTANVSSSGWKRVGYCIGPKGRGFGKITMYTQGGQHQPLSVDAEWFKDWNTDAGLTVKSNAKAGLWTAFRLTFNVDTTFIEANFTGPINTLSLVSDSYGWNVAKLYSGNLPEGGGIVRAEAAVGKFAIDDYFSVGFNGNIGVGTAIPSEKLSVNGNIRAKEIKVETANWPDYVFEEGYQLLPLSQIEKFIKANRHLPDVPDAATIEGDGLSLGEMNRVLLKKIEELTLHIISQEKRIRLLEEKNTLN